MGVVFPRQMQQQIARIVRAITRSDIPAHAGSCIWRATVGHVVLAELGIETEIVIGAAAYGATPEITLRFCRDDFTASLDPVPGMPGHSRLHCWLLTSRDEIADFSTAYWSLQHPHIAFVVEPPAFVWTKRRTVTGTPPPALGKIYYGEPIAAPDLQARIADDVATLRQRADIVSFIRSAAGQPPAVRKPALC